MDYYWIPRDAEEGDDMRNAATELRRAILDAKIIAADIWFANLKETGSSRIQEITLYEDSTEEELEEFWSKLDFTYDPSGDDMKYMYGKVWLDGCASLERSEYGGVDGWVHNSPPKRETT